MGDVIRVNFKPKKTLLNTSLPVKILITIIAFLVGLIAIL